MPTHSGKLKRLFLFLSQQLPGIGGGNAEGADTEPCIEPTSGVGDCPLWTKGGFPAEDWSLVARENLMRLHAPDGCEGLHHYSDGTMLLRAKGGATVHIDEAGRLLDRSDLFSDSLPEDEQLRSVRKAVLDRQAARAPVKRDWLWYTGAGTLMGGAEVGEYLVRLEQCLAANALSIEHPPAAANSAPRQDPPGSAPRQDPQGEAVIDGGEPETRQVA